MDMNNTTENPVTGANGAPAGASTQAAARHFAEAVALHLQGRREAALGELDSAEENGRDAAQISAARGHIQFELRRFEDAACSYSRLCELDPGNSEARFVLGLCYHQLGHHAEALKSFEAVLAANRGHLNARLAAGTCLLHLNKHAEALEAFRAAQGLAPESEAAQFGQAVALQMGWDFDEAAAIYQRILARNPNSEDSLVNMISIGLHRKDYAMVQSCAERLLAAHPESGAALEGLAAAAFYRQDLDAAARHARKLTEVAPQVFDNWFNLGVALQKLNRPQEAIAAYQRAIQLRPEAIFAHINLGVVYQDLGELAGARAAFEQASQIAPYRDDLKFHVAWIAEQQKSAGEAEQLYAQVVEKNPELENAWFRLGYLRLEKQDFAGAVTPFEKCIAKRGDWPEAQINLALAHWRLGQFAEAEGVLEKLHQHHPENVDAIKGLAETAVQLGQPEKALRYHRMLIDRGNAAPQVYYNAGVLAQHLNDVPAAIELYRGALQAQPEFAEALLNLGHAFESIGNNDDARASWIQALTLKPELARDYFLPRAE